MAAISAVDSALRTVLFSPSTVEELKFTMPLEFKRAIFAVVAPFNMLAFNPATTAELSAATSWVLSACNTTVSRELFNCKAVMLAA